MTICRMKGDKLWIMATTTRHRACAKTSIGLFTCLSHGKGNELYSSIWPRLLPNYGLSVDLSLHKAPQIPGRLRKHEPRQVLVVDHDHNRLPCSPFSSRSRTRLGSSANRSVCDANKRERESMSRQRRRQESVLIF